MKRKRREPIGPDIKGRLTDGREFWIFKGEPWDEWKEQKETYAKFADGKVSRFAGFENEESLELGTENYQSTPALHPTVRGICRGLIKFDGVVVYGFLAADIEHGLIHAYHVLGKLRGLRRTLFRDLSPEGMADTFVNRQVYYRDIPARVIRYDARNGTVHLSAEEGFLFPRLAPNLEKFPTMEDDLLSDHIRWDRDDEEDDE